MQLLPPEFIENYIVDQLNSIKAEYFKRIHQRELEFVITTDTEYIKSQVMVIINTLFGSKFNEYIFNKLGNPKEYLRPNQIMRYEDNDTNIHLWVVK